MPLRHNCSIMRFNSSLNLATTKVATIPLALLAGHKDDVAVANLDFRHFTSQELNMLLNFDPTPP